MLSVHPTSPTCLSFSFFSFLDISLAQNTILRKFESHTLARLNELVKAGYSTYKFQVLSTDEHFKYISFLLQLKDKSRNISFQFLTHTEHNIIGGVYLPCCYFYSAKIKTNTASSHLSEQTMHQLKLVQEANGLTLPGTAEWKYCTSQRYLDQEKL